MNARPIQQVRMVNPALSRVARVYVMPRVGGSSGSDSSSANGGKGKVRRWVTPVATSGMSQLLRCLRNLYAL